MIKKDDGTYDLWLITALTVVLLAVIALLGAVLTNSKYSPPQFPPGVQVPIEQRERP